MSICVLAIDQGTTNTKALLVDTAGTIIARGSVPTPVHYPRPGWVEQDPREIWRCTLEAIASCLDSAPAGITIGAIGIANQRETALIWERRTGSPVGPAVVWQCRRSAPICHELNEAGFGPLLQARTGLQVDPMFSGSKLRWLLDHAEQGHERARDGALCAGNVDTWLLWNLTGGPDSTSAVHVTDATNASRTLLMNLEDLTWDQEALDVLRIPRRMLPTIGPSSAVHGTTVSLSLPGGAKLPAHIPIGGLIGDSHASLYGLGGFRPGSIKATYGTGTSVMTPTPTDLRSSHGLSSTVAWAIAKATVGSIGPETTYALEGNIYTTGGAVQYIGDLLGLSDPAAGVEALAKSVGDAAGVVFVPALVGLGAPYWDERARGTITGLSLGTGREHLARAALDAIAFQVRDVFDVMQSEAGLPLQVLLADGGASQNDLLMQLQADTLGCPVERSRSSEVSPLGAAYLAGLAVGIWQSQDSIVSILPTRDRFEPGWSPGEREEAYARWSGAVDQARLRL